MKPSLKDALGDIQYALTTPGASSTAINVLKDGVHLLRTRSCFKQTTKQHTKAKTEVALKRIYDEPAFAVSWRYLHWSYGQGGTPLWILNNNGIVLEQLESSSGWRQGCVMGPFGFAGGAHKTFRAAAAQDLDHYFFIVTQKDLHITPQGIEIF
eukprot:Lithocolla_globosa_v1_NODE_31_length_8897_cov_62.719634.p5 type:complete len:154 gc:universal NODE_31_length_8897_cov_62.719634:541-1002(+)